MLGILLFCINKLINVIWLKIGSKVIFKQVFKLNSSLNYTFSSKFITKNSPEN
jgi:hypothetical protein